jgi:hypothetical protein
MRLTLYFLIGIFLFSCGNTSVSSNNTATDTSSLNADTVRPPVIDTVPNPSTSVSTNLSDRRIKAIEDIYFGIPSSEHGRHFNKQITLGDCNFKVKYLGYNDYSLGDNTISGLYSFRINSESVCSDIEYLVTLFSTKYGQPKRIISNEVCCYAG